MYIYIYDFIIGGGGVDVECEYGVGYRHTLEHAAWGGPDI